MKNYDLFKITYVKINSPHTRFKYMTLEPYRYISYRYSKTVTLPTLFLSDGATWAIDIPSNCWWVHDYVCEVGKFDDGTRVTHWQNSTILYDIMRSEGFSLFRSMYWRLATFFFGGGKTRNQGMFSLRKECEC